MLKNMINTKVAIAIASIAIVGIITTVFLSGCSRETQDIYTDGSKQQIITTEEDKTEDKSVSEEILGKNDNYILPESNIRYIEYTDILNFDTYTLNLAKNEIYARHGYIFNNESISEYFMAHTWYKPSVQNADFNDSVFNEYEIANIALLEDYEKASGYTYPLEVKNGETVKIDLNGDGKLESISFSAKIDNDEINSINNKTTITINGITKKYQSGEGDMTNLYIVDIDTEDNAKEICFAVEEPNDYISNIFWQYSMNDELKRIYFDNESLYLNEDMEESEYEYPDGDCAYEITYLGDGRIICFVKCTSITEYLVNCEYQLTEDGCFKFIDRIYEFPTDPKRFFAEEDGIDLILKKKLEIHKEPDTSSDTFTIEPQKIKIIAACASSDENNIYWWSKFELEDGRTGWFQPPSTMVLFDFEDMFDGVWFAS